MIKQWIRWPGLIAFVVVFGGLGAFGYFFAGGLIKSTIEKQGSEALGAKVSVSSVKLALDPLGLQFNQFEAANPEAPMTNAVSFDSANMEVSFWHLFMGQVIVNDVSIDNMQFNTARTSSGAYKSKSSKLSDGSGKGTGTEEKEGGLKDSAKELAEKALPSAKEILDRETLLTETVSKELKSLYEAKKTRLDSLKSGLPDKGKLSAYEKEIKQLTTTKLKSLDDFNQRKKRLKEIKASLKNDQALLKQAKNEYKESYDILKLKLEELKDAPSNDLKRLKQKYNLNAGGASNISQLLFGGKSGEWTEQALYWYEKAKPYLASAESEEKQKVERLKGRYVHFGGVEVLPEFLLRNASIDMSLPSGHLQGELTDLTHQPEILKRPARLSVKGDKLKGYQSIDLNAEFNHIDPKNSFDSADLKIRKMEISEFSVSKDSKYPLSLQSARADITGNATVKNGRVNLKGVSDFTQAQFKSDGASGTAKHVAELLASISEFDVRLKASGDLKDVDVSLDSSLDDKLKAALKGKLKAKQKELERELKAKLEKKVSGVTGKYSGDLAKISKLEGDTDAKQEQLKGMLSSKVADYKAQVKKELAEKKAKAKKELDARKAKEKKALADKKAAAEKKAKAEAKKKAEKALKDKFGF